MYDESAFFFKIPVSPQVVVAGEEMHLHAHVGQLGKFAEKARVPLRYDIFIFVPEVEHIAQQIDGGGFSLDAVEEAHEPAFMHSAVRDGQRAEMGVGEEINVLCH